MSDNSRLNTITRAVCATAADFRRTHRRAPTALELRAMTQNEIANPGHAAEREARLETTRRYAAQCVHGPSAIGVEIKRDPRTGRVMSSGEQPLTFARAGASGARRAAIHGAADDAAPIGSFGHGSVRLSRGM